jgi:hypothetical protein
VKGGGSADQGRRRRAAHLQEPVGVLLLEDRRSRTAPASGWGGLAGYDLRGRSRSRRGRAGAWNPNKQSSCSNRRASLERIVKQRPASSLGMDAIVLQPESGQRPTQRGRARDDARSHQWARRRGGWHSAGSCKKGRCSSSVSGKRREAVR